MELAGAARRAEETLEPAVRKPRGREAGAQGTWTLRTRDGGEAAGGGSPGDPGRPGRDLGGCGGDRAPGDGRHLAPYDRCQSAGDRPAEVDGGNGSRRPDEIPAGGAKSLGNTGGTCPAFPQERARGAEGGRFSWRRSNGVKRFGRAGLQARGVGGSGVAGSPWGARTRARALGPLVLKGFVEL